MAARRRDARKDEVMRSLGLTVFRLTWADVAARPAGTAERLRTATNGGSIPRREDEATFVAGHSSRAK